MVLVEETYLTGMVTVGVYRDVLATIYGISTVARTATTTG